MLHNQETPMDLTGSAGQLGFTGVTTNIAGCTVEFPGAGPGTFGTLALSLTASLPNSIVFSDAGGVFGEFELKGAGCGVAGTYVIEGTSVTGSVTNDVLTINSTTELRVNGEKATLTGAATITAGTTGGAYHPIELKES